MPIDTVYARTIALSITASYIGFVIFTYCLIDWDIADSAFFSVDFCDPAVTTGLCHGLDDARPKLLDLRIATKGRFAFIAGFFFFNAFMSEWNGVVINCIFTKMECGNGSGTTFHGKQQLLFALFTVYDIWCGVRRFFGILGLMSNYVWMVSTIAGGLTASIVTKLMYLHNAEYACKHGGGDWAQYIKEVPAKRARRKAPVPAKTSRPLGPVCVPLHLSALVRARASDAGVGYSRI